MSEHPFTILIVDDNPVNREVWSMYLGNEGYRVETSSNGLDALKLAEDKPIDLVLLDILMPGLDGFEVLEKLRRETSPEQLPVLMTTGKDKSEDIVKGFDLGANDYLVKPIHLDVLAARVQSQLRGKMPAGSRSPDPALGPTSSVQQGTLLAGRFRVEELIGQGSCGAVYRATHLGLHRPVAIKLLTAAAGAASEARLQREGISACRIEHENAVEVLDLCVTDTGIPFLVMELLQGHSLEDELKQQGSLPLERVLEILPPICEVLAEAHRKGIIHRDVKPQNVFLHRNRQREVVKMLDFGIAKMIGESVLSRRLTLEGSLVGTPAYMAPERLADTTYDGRADVYSLGIMLYEMLAGRRPFSSNDLLDLIRMHIHDPPRPLQEVCPELPRGITAIILRTLAKDPESRPTAEELGRDFVAAARDDDSDDEPRTAHLTPVPSSPDAARPDAARPDAARPDAARPDAARPEATRQATVERAPTSTERWQTDLDERVED